MAIGQTMSNSSDWIFQPYQNDFSHISQNEIIPTNASAAAADATSAAVTRNSNYLSPEQGRVSKPMRRRSRASRRTPTTLLNTDTTNFRAMVQHFTGGPAATFAATSQTPYRGGTILNYREHTAATNVAAVPVGGFHVQYPNQMQQQHHMFMIDNMHGSGGGGSGGGLTQAPPLNENRSCDNYML